MTVSMYQISAPVFIHTLGNLKKILKKAERHAAARKIDPAVFLNARLAPDMHPLTRQIQIASDTVKGCAARLSGRAVPSFKDNEKSFADLYRRIDRTIAFVRKVKAQEIDGTETKQIELKFPQGSIKFKGKAYLLNFVLPNLYFHVTTAYAILRHNGVNVGKRDFIGKV